MKPRKVIWSKHCTICGFPLFPEIVSCDHHLFTTIDHIQPKSKGGRDYSGNRRLAHRICNNKRADRNLTPELIYSIQGIVVGLLQQRYGIPTKKKDLRAARQRLGLPVSPEFARESPSWTDLQRWEDDGGPARYSRKYRLTSKS